ncbi:MAG TPA: AgmX/PglI C-terminal domain-containing protein [Byssovorax sp.]
MPAPASTPPPPPATNNTPYIVGIIVLALLAFGLYRWKSSSNAPVAPQVTTVTANAPKQDDVPILNAPPPPPKAEDVPDAGDDDAGAKVAPKSTGGTAAGPGGCGSTCQGTATPALQGALRGTAQSAQGCYNRALRTSEVSGNLTVSVQVGPSGNVCGASLATDNVHSNEITQCVLGRFRGHNFPPPSNGCVTVNIPINFTIKQ